MNLYKQIEKQLQKKGYSEKVIILTLAYIREHLSQVKLLRKDTLADNLRDNPFYQYFDKVLGQPLRELKGLQAEQIELKKRCEKIGGFLTVANLSMSWRKLKQSMKRLEAVKPTIAGIRDQLDDVYSAIARQFRSGARTVTVSLAGGMERDYEPVSGPPAIYEEMKERARIRNNAMGVEEIRGPLGNYDNHRN